MCAHAFPPTKPCVRDILVLLMRKLAFSGLPGPSWMESPLAECLPLTGASAAASCVCVSSSPRTSHPTASVIVKTTAHPSAAQKPPLAGNSSNHWPPQIRLRAMAPPQHLSQAKQPHSPFIHSRLYLPSLPLPGVLVTCLGVEPSMQN